MKIIVELRWSPKDYEVLGLKNYVEYYEKYYKENGILIDEESESIYYETEVSQFPSEGQRVGTKFGTCLVYWSYYNLDEETIFYFDKTRIVVSEE
jgi:hypothetical protein